MPGMEGFINFNGTLEGSIAGGAGGDVKDVKVRDSQETEFESVVNEQGVAEIDLISYVRRNELTQAIENVENSIDNVVELVDTKQNIINYSTEEQLTGKKWVDGKDIYFKVCEVPSMTVRPTGTPVTTIDISAIDTFINGYGISQELGQMSPLSLYDYNGLNVASIIAITIDKIIMYYTKVTE